MFLLMSWMKSACCGAKGTFTNIWAATKKPPWWQFVISCFCTVHACHSWRAPRKWIHHETLRFNRPLDTVRPLAWRFFVSLHLAVLWHPKLVHFYCRFRSPWLGPLIQSEFTKAQSILKASSESILRVWENTSCPVADAILNSMLQLSEFILVTLACSRSSWQYFKIYVAQLCRSPWTTSRWWGWAETSFVSWSRRDPVRTLKTHGQDWKTRARKLHCCSKFLPSRLGPNCSSWL